MTDILCLISDGPCKDGENTTEKHYNLLTSIVKRSGLTALYKFVYPYYTDSLKKITIMDNMHNIMNTIEETHPSVILAFGDKAFICLGLPSTKITEIANIPQKSPFFGGESFDIRTKTYKLKESLPSTIDGRPCLHRVVRGSERKYDFTETIKLVSHKDIVIFPTYKHNSMLSYGCGYKGQALLERQLERIKEIVKEKKRNPEYKKYNLRHYKKFITLHRTKADLKSAKKSIKYWKTQSKRAFDIETAGYNVPKEAQLNFRHIEAEITVIGIGNEEHVDVYNTHNLPELIPLISEVFSQDIKAKNMTWNGKFDIEFMKYLWGTKFNHTHIDGMTCLYLRDLNVSFLGKGAATLKFTSATFLENGSKYAGYQKNAGIDVAIKAGDGQYLAEHEEEYMIYCGIDVWLTYKTVVTLWKGLEKDARKLVIKYYPELTEMLNKIHAGGITVNNIKLNQYMENLQDFLEKLEKLIGDELTKIENSISGRPFKQHPFNPKSGKHLCEILYDILGLPVCYTEKGSRSVTTEVLELHHDIPFCKLVSDYRSFLKQHELFGSIKKHIKGDKCYPRYNQYRTTSGRLTASDPPIQIVPSNKRITTWHPTSNDPSVILPHRPVWVNHSVVKSKKSEGGYELLEISPNFKEVFIADPGMIMLYADYSQLEIVVLANYISKCSSCRILQNAIIEGRDIHSYTCSLLYSALMGKTYAEEFITAHKHEQPYKGWRQDSKSVIFKLIYGGTYISMAKEKGIPEEEAKKVFDTFLSVIPGIQTYMNNQKFLAKRKCKIKTWPGHSRDLGVYKYERYNSKANNIALNHPIQGTASYIVNLAMMEYHRRIKEVSSNSRILLTIHDSIASQVPNDKEHIKHGLKLKRECMQDYIMTAYNEFLSVPVKMDMELGINWHNTKNIFDTEYGEYYASLGKAGK